MEKKVVFPRRGEGKEIFKLNNPKLEEADCLEFDRWVQEGRKFFTPEMDTYHFLYGLRGINHPRTELNRLILLKLNQVEKNLKEIYSYDICGVRKLIEEIRINIIISSEWSSFYSLYCLMEKVLDILIIRENKLLNEYFPFIKEQMQKGNFTIDKKIFIIKKLNGKNFKPDLKALINFSELMQRIRNKFMFHLNNYEEYSFVFPDIGEKEDMFVNNIKFIREAIESSVELLNERSVEKQILLYYSDVLNKITGFLSQNRSNQEVYVSNNTFYEELPEFFSQIACILIILLAKDDLNLI
jgi:hypothetical protein